MVTFGGHSNPHAERFMLYLFRFLNCSGILLYAPGNLDPEVKNHSPILWLWDYLVLLSKSEDFLGARTECGLLLSPL